jgi:hypothetical protein
LSQRTRAAKGDKSETARRVEKAEKAIRAANPEASPSGGMAAKASPSRAARTPRDAEEMGSTPAPSVSSPQPTDPAANLSPDALARALRAVAGELERDPDLARRVADAMRGDGGHGSGTLAHAAERPPARTAPEAAATGDGPPVASGRSFRPRIITGTAADLGPGVPDPFALRDRLGEAGLRAILDDLRLGSLRAIIREHRLDSANRLRGVNDAEKLRALILTATAAREHSKIDSGW